MYPPPVLQLLSAQVEGSCAQPGAVSTAEDAHGPRGSSTVENVAAPREAQDGTTTSIDVPCSNGAATSRGLD